MTVSTVAADGLMVNVDPQAPPAQVPTSRKLRSNAEPFIDAVKSDVNVTVPAPPVSVGATVMLALTLPVITFNMSVSGFAGAVTVNTGAPLALNVGAETLTQGAVH